MSELGELIRSARQRKNISLTEAAQETRIRRLYLEALEDGDYDVLPGRAYVAGFLRNYAKYLGLNDEEIVETYYALHPPDPVGVRPLTKVVDERLKRRSRRRFSWFFVGVGVVLLCAAAFQKYSNYAHAGGNTPLAISTSGLSSPNPPPKKVLAATMGLGYKPVSVAIHVQYRDWVRVTVDGKQQFAGRLFRGAERRWAAHSSVSVFSWHGNAVKLTVNGRWVGPMSETGAASQGRATISGWGIDH